MQFVILVRYFFMWKQLYFCSSSIIRCMCNIYFFVFYEYYAIIFYFITVCECVSRIILV